MGIFVGSGTGVGTAGHDNDNLTIENNALSKASFAIYAISETTGLIENLVIKDNIIGSNDATSYVVNRGIVLQGTLGAQVIGNEIFNLIPAANGQEKTGIELKDNVTNTLIKENMIHDFSCPAGFAGSSIGIHINTTNMTANNTTIVNNLIYNLTTSSFNATHLLYNPFGIRINGGTGHKLYHNTVRMTGTQATYSTNGGSLSAALLVLNLASVTEMKDNIFTNDIVGLTGSRSFCIYMDKAVPVWILSSDYNDLYPSGPYGLCGMYSPASNVEINCPTLADWQTASGMDAHSKSVDPVFTSATSLVPTTTLMPHAGIYIPDFPTDFANVTRTNPPDIGAYEYSLLPLVVTTAASGVTSTTAVLNGTINPQGLTVDGYFEYGLTTDYGNSVATTPATVTGNAAVPVSASLSGLLPNTTYHFRAKGVDQGGLIVFGSDQTFTTVLSAEAEFLSFAFYVAENPILTADVYGTIDPATFTITLDVLEYVSLSSLVATFTLSDLATASIGGVVQVSGVTSNNFTNPVVYTVTAEAGNTQNWTVNVTALTCTCPWNYVVTGSIHTINIPLAAAPEVFGVPLAPDDWIGIFFLNDNGEETCGGAVQWTGTGNVAIIAYGNDPTTPEKDGFASGETFRWRLSQCGNPIDYTAAATYDPTMPNQGNFAGFGLSKLTSLKAAYIQYFTLNQGWNGMSGYLVPIDPAVQNMFAPIVNKLTILGNLTSVYWPSQGVNTIGNWNSNSGYAAKITENVDFMILGGSYAPSTMTVPAGWSYLPVHSQCEANVMEMFGENLSKVVIIQDLIGTNIFWPAMGIYTLQNFEPGKAYKIKLTNAVTVTFPECSTKSVTKVTSTDNNIETVWGNLNMTPNTQVSLFMSEVTGNLIEGDVIGAFDQEGHIYGYLALSGEKENQAMTLCGDDNSLAEKEGFVNGESVSYKLFRTSTGETYDLEVFYSAVLENTSGNFEAGSFAAISGFKLGATGVENLTGSSTGIYPNPTSEIVNITGITSTTQVRIFNVFGEEVFFTELSTSSAINVASLQKGMYVIKISNENGEKLNKLIIR